MTVRDSFTREIQDFHAYEMQLPSNTSVCIIDVTHMWASIVRQLGNCTQVPLLYWLITYSPTGACYCNVLLSSKNTL